jgi:chromosome segregation ATPase
MQRESSGRLLAGLALVEEEDETARIRGEADRERLARLEWALAESEAGRAARLNDMNELDRLLKVSEADRAARLRNVNELERLLKESEADSAARLRNLTELKWLLKESEADRSALLKRIEALERIIAGVDRPPSAVSVTFDRFGRWVGRMYGRLARQATRRLR